MLRRWADLGLIVALMGVLGGCVRAEAGGTAGEAPSSSAGIVATSASAESNVAAPGVEIYAVPAKDPRDDDSLFMHTIGTSQSTDVALGPGTDAWAVPAVAPDGSASAQMQWYSSTAAVMTFDHPGEGQLSMAVTTPDSGADPTIALTSLEAAGIRYVQVGGSVVATKNGTVVATYALPVLKPDDSAGQPPRGYTGIYAGTGTGTVSALVPASNGDVLAFTFTGRAAAVTDLMTSVTTPIFGRSRLGSAARTASGDILVVAWNGQDDSAPIQVVVLDGETLAVASTIDTGLAATDHLRDIVLPGLGHDAVIAVSHGDSDVALNLWMIDGRKAVAGPALPVNSGLTIAPSGAASVDVYGGPARNTVGQLDLSSGTFSKDIPTLRGPAGSYIVGILF